MKVVFSVRHVSHMAQTIELHLSSKYVDDLAYNILPIRGGRSAYEFR
jgi:hypothetical protein